jgi:hypothetical protein
MVMLNIVMPSVVVTNVVAPRGRSRVNRERENFGFTFETFIPFSLKFVTRPQFEILVHRNEPKLERFKGNEL